MFKRLDTHYKVALRVLYYLKGSHAQGLFSFATLKLRHSTFVDFDWTYYLDTEDLSLGYVIFLAFY